MRLTLLLALTATASAANLVKNNNSKDCQQYEDSKLNDEEVNKCLPLLLNNNNNNTNMSTETWHQKDDRLKQLENHSPASPDTEDDMPYIDNSTEKSPEETVFPSCDVYEDVDKLRITWEWTTYFPGFNARVGDGFGETFSRFLKLQQHVGKLCNTWEWTTQFTRFNALVGHEFDETFSPFLKLQQHPVPPFPSSSDYKEFCEIIGLDPSHLSCLGPFHELFELDQQGKIVGTTGNVNTEGLITMMSPYSVLRTRERMLSIPKTKLSKKYSKIAPWVDAVVRDLEQCYEMGTRGGMLPRDTYLEERFDHLLGSESVKGFYHIRKLLIAAIVHNFDETDWRRDILLAEGITKNPKDSSPSKTLLWFEGDIHDFSETFDTPVLEQFRECLNAYAEDSRDLATRGPVTAYTYIPQPGDKQWL